MHKEKNDKQNRTKSSNLTTHDGLTAGFENRFQLEEVRVVFILFDGLDDERWPRTSLVLTYTKK